MQNVLELMLYSYAFMVSGLFIPVIGGLFLKRLSPTAAFWSMIAGGATTIYLIFSKNILPFGIQLNQNLDANIFGITASLLTYFIIHFLTQKRSLPFGV